MSIGFPLETFTHERLVIHISLNKNYKKEETFVQLEHLVSISGCCLLLANTWREKNQPPWSAKMLLGQILKRRPDSISRGRSNRSKWETYSLQLSWIYPSCWNPDEGGLWLLEQSQIEATRFFSYLWAPSILPRSPSVQGHLFTLGAEFLGNGSWIAIGRKPWTLPDPQISATKLTYLEKLLTSFSTQSCKYRSKL